MPNQKKQKQMKNQKKIPNKKKSGLILVNMDIIKHFMTQLQIYTRVIEPAINYMQTYVHYFKVLKINLIFSQLRYQQLTLLQLIWPMMR